MIIKALSQQTSARKCQTCFTSYFKDFVYDLWKNVNTLERVDTFSISLLKVHLDYFMI